MLPACEVLISQNKTSDSRGFINILSLDNNSLNSAVVIRLIL